MTQTNIYGTMFGDSLPINQAASKIVRALQMQGRIIRLEQIAESKNAHGMRAEGEGIYNVAKIISSNINDLFNVSDERGTAITIYDAIDALTRESGEDYSWLKKIVGQNPRVYARTHPELFPEQIALLEGL